MYAMNGVSRQVSSSPSLLTTTPFARQRFTLKYQWFDWQPGTQISQRGTEPLVSLETSAVRHLPETSDSCFGYCRLRIIEQCWMDDALKEYQRHYIPQCERGNKAFCVLYVYRFPIHRGLSFVGVLMQQVER